MTATPTATSILPAGAIEVSAQAGSRGAAAGMGEGGAGNLDIAGQAARVAVLIVTWNRRDFVASVLEAVSRQEFDRSCLDVIVVDNASTDGTLDHLAGRFRPDRVIDNLTHAAHEPNFQTPRATPAGASAPTARNTLGLASLTIVRNTDNFGGCGGFNTGFAFVEHAGAKGFFARPDYLWLVDDDVDLPPDALKQLSRVMREDAEVGLVGSRTCDIRQRDKTIETTIYFNSNTGLMQDEAPETDRRREDFETFRARTGGVRGRGRYAGTMRVDVVSACSMLARWDAIVGGRGALGRAPVGFWDHRYFIYCDDADWCLRFGKRGWRVVLNLDAVVYHTPWLLKLTPARIYYANRNRFWMARKVLPTPQLRRATRRGVRMLLRESLYAGLHRRLFHAHIMLTTLDDARVGRPGKTGSDGPEPMPVVAALEKAGAIRAGGREGRSRVAVVCNTDDSLALFEALRKEVALKLSGRPGPQWICFLESDAEGAAPGGQDCRVIRYSRAWPSRMMNQSRIAGLHPAAAIVFDQNNDLPMMNLLGRGPEWTLHIDQRKPAVAQLERDTWSERFGFLRRWVGCAWRSFRWAATITPVEHTTKYG